MFNGRMFAAMASPTVASRTLSPPEVPVEPPVLISIAPSAEGSLHGILYRFQHVKEDVYLKRLVEVLRQFLQKKKRS